MLVVTCVFECCVELERDDVVLAFLDEEVLGAIIGRGVGVFGEVIEYKVNPFSKPIAA